MNDPKGILGNTVGTTGAVTEGVHIGVGIDKVGTANEELGKPKVGNVVGPCAALLNGAAVTRLLTLA